MSVATNGSVHFDLDFVKMALLQSKNKNIPFMVCKFHLLIALVAKNTKFPFIFFNIASTRHLDLLFVTEFTCSHLSAVSVH